MDVNVTIRIDRIDDLIKAAGMLAGLHGEEASPAQKPYSAQIAQATQIPAQAMTGQASPAAPIAQPAQAATPTPIAQPAQAATPAVPTAEHTYTAEELQVAAVALVDKGMMVQLQGLLQQFEVNSLPELPAEKYGAFATALRGMGAQI